MAFDQRFAVVLVGSSGEGGAKLHRRNFGEAVENLTGSGEYHWMAGNFLKYGAAESTFGSKNAGDIPVDAHELIALCAPRPTFISYGVPEKGDAKWLDQQGSYMAAVAAQPVFRLLGAKDLGVSDDYTTEKMPAVNVGLLDGQLAWRQHDGGHTDGPNWKYFIPWADKFLGAHARRPRRRAVAGPISRPSRDRRRTRMTAHAAAAREGASAAASTSTSTATRSRGAGARPTIRSCSPTGTTNFFGWNAARLRLGRRPDAEHPLALENGELDGVNPKVIVLLAGTNNVGKRAGRRRQGRGDHARPESDRRPPAARRRRTRRSS